MKSNFLIQEGWYNPQRWQQHDSDSGISKWLPKTYTCNCIASHNVVKNSTDGPAQGLSKCDLRTSSTTMAYELVSCNSSLTPPTHWIRNLRGSWYFNKPCRRCGCSLRFQKHWTGQHLLVPRLNRTNSLSCNLHNTLSWFIYLFIFKHLFIIERQR